MPAPGDPQRGSHGLPLGRDVVLLALKPEELPVGTISFDEFRQATEECGFRTKLTSGKAFGPAEEEYFTSRCQEVGCEVMFRTRKEDGHVLRFDLDAIREHHKLHGPFCGVQDGPWDRKKNPACIHRKGHAGPHSNGRRTWRGEKPKKGRK